MRRPILSLPILVQPGVRSRWQGAYTMMEVLAATLILLVVGIAGTRSLAVINQRAAMSRVRVNARAAVERNIARVLSAPFDTTTPAILNTTSASGEVYDDDGGGDNKISLLVQDTGGTAVIFGTMTRIVTAVANSQGVDIRRVTFRIAYQMRGRDYTYEATTIRAKG